MGANASTAVPLYASGQVLDAARLNLTNAGIPVFSGTATRDAAFGGSGEKVLAEGQFAYLEDTNAVQYYDGAAFQAVGAASGLTLVKKQTIGSAVSSVTVTDAFSSTYGNYFVTINGGVGSTNMQLRLTFGSTATGYYYGANKVEYIGNSGVFNGSNVNFVAECIYGSTNGISLNLFVQAPNLAARTGFQYNTAGMSTVAVILSVRGGGYLDNATQYTAFTLTADTGTITGGDILVYGYANS